MTAGARGAALQPLARLVSSAGGCVCSAPTALGERLFIRLHRIPIPAPIMMRTTAVHAARQLRSDAFFIFLVF